MAGRASAQAAYETRLSILGAAADLASVEGLDSVTIGRLADRLEMSKSGVIGQFGSKEQLQVETIDHVSALFVDRVWEPAKRLTPGLPRLLAVLRGWVAYTLDPGFTGGCFLTQAAFDYDGREGPVHDRIARNRASWRRTVRQDIAAATEAGDLPEHTDPDQVAYGVESLITGITPARLLHGDHDKVEAWAMTGIESLLGLRAGAQRTRATRPSSHTGSSDS